MGLTGRLTALLILVSVVAQAGNACERRNYKHWIDADGDGCNTRCEILTRDSDPAVAVVRAPGGRVVSGLWVDPYTGLKTRDADQLQVDHIIAICEADRAGASAWTAERRQAFANDPENLIAVYGPSNQSKGARSPATWMPPNVFWWAEYLDRRAYLEEKYGLVTASPEVIKVRRRAAAYHRLGVKFGSAWWQRHVFR